MTIWLCLLMLLPTSAAFAQSEPPIGLHGSATVLHPAPGVDYYYDLNGGSSTVYQTAPNTSWYSSQDSQGRITSDGYLFDPNPRPEPLRVPQSSYRPNAETDRDACTTRIRC